MSARITWITVDYGDCDGLRWDYGDRITVRITGLR